MTSLSDVAAYVRRGDGVDAWHQASICVINGVKEITHSFGDPELVTFTRSSIKPLQALPLLTTGAADRYGFTPKEIALACGSHNGTDEHKATAESMLSKAGNRPEDLQCGGHWPSFMQSATQYPLQGEDKDPARNNCSGKHAGFLAVARHRGEDVAEYLSPDSQIQTLVRDALSEMMEYDVSQAPRGVDGCSAPNYATPLPRLAIGFLKTATAIAGPSARISDAMRTHPEMVSGERRFDLAVMRTFPHNVLCKVGAEGIQVMAFRDPATAIVVKVHDGATRALNPICVETLRQLGLLDGRDLSHLGPYIHPAQRNHRLTVTGEIVAEFTLNCHIATPLRAAAR